MPTFRKPNLEPQNLGSASDPYLSVRSDRETLGLSQPAVEVLGAEPGQRLHLALDRTYKPWIGIIETRTDQGEPKIRMAGSTLKINSTLLCRQLTRILDAQPDGVLRYYLTGETEEDPDTGILLHELKVPTP